MKTRNRQIALEVRDDMPARFVEMYDEAGRGKGRSLVVELISVGVALKELDPRLFRMIQASAENDSLNINDLSVYIDACRKLAKETTPQAVSEDHDQEEVTPSEKPEKLKSGGASSGFQGMIS